MTAYETVITEAAKEDLKQAQQWQQDYKGEGAAEVFADYFFDFIEGLRIFPRKHPIKYDDKRVALMKRFDYALHYTITGHLITITGLHHQKQNPQKWNKRD